jgi:monoamine oxidase
MRKPFKNKLLFRLYRDFRQRHPHPAVVSPPQESRRAFLQQTAYIGTGLLLGSSWLSSCNAFSSSAKGRVAVIGGGIAGLIACRQLEKAGITCDVYEATDRLGGRIKTGYTTGQQPAPIEWGGEFFNSDHALLIDLLKELQLEAVDTLGDDLDEEVYFIDGVVYSYDAVYAVFEQVALDQFQIDMELLPEFIESGNIHLWKLYDSISLATYLKALKIPSWFRSIISSAFEGEFGMEAKEQSAMLFMSLFDPQPDYFDVFGHHDRRYKIKGGSEQLIQRLQQQLQSPVFLSHRLQYLEADSQKVILGFHHQQEVSYEYVVLALPYTALRQVEIKAPLSRIRTRAIQELGYGQKRKAFMGFNEPVWRHRGLCGDAYANGSFLWAWDNGRNQMLSDHVLGLSLKKEDYDRITPAALLQDLSAVFPGAEIAYNDRMYMGEYPPDDPLYYSHSVYTIGQWSLFYGAEDVDEGRVLFAGEHVSRVFQGSMNGAIESGIKAADTIVQRIVPSA